MTKNTVSLFSCTFTLVIFTLLRVHSAWAVPFQGHKMLMTGPSPYAVQVGQKIADLGGNVVDVAVAMGLTLSVTSPYNASLGGGGFALVKMDKNEVSALDFRETAPAATHSELFSDKPATASVTGGMAVGVPGMAMGLWDLHQRYGKLKWERLFVDPLELAQDGFAVSGEWAETTREESARGNPAGWKHLLPNGKPLKAGQVIKQPDLAQALQILRRKGPKGFYEGSVADDIVTTVTKAGGSLSLADLKNYRTRWLKPIVQNYQGYNIYLMPPPSSGGILIATFLQLAEGLQLKNQAPRSVQEYHFLGEILQRAFRSRTFLGDPAFYQNPMSNLLSPSYIKTLIASVKPKRASRLEPLDQPPPTESSETTHYTVMDVQGNSASLTVTLNGSYGSGLVSDKYGIALNNEMDDFTTRLGRPNIYGLIQGAGNKVEPGKRPLSSMSPTLVEKDGKMVAALGAPGGPRIISGVAQVLYRLLTNKMDIDTAIQQPRVHQQFQPNVLFVDINRFSPDVLQALRQMGHKVEEKWWVGRVNGIHLKDDGVLEAAFDSRGEGAAGGR